MRVTSFYKQYKGYKVQMKDIHSTKRIVVLKGENGSGKSTILKAMNNMISYKGLIDSKGTKSYMNEIIRFPSDMTVLEIVNSINCIDGVSKEKMITLIDQFELIDEINKKISTLSKGMKMKLQLVCTFLVEKDIYILDEPFSGLDHASVIRLVGYIQKSTKKFVIATHIDLEWKQDCDVIMI